MEKTAKILAVATVVAAILTAPASAVVRVYMSPAEQSPVFPEPTAQVSIYADIPNTEAIIGWGLDVDLIGDNMAVAGMPTIGPAWTPVFAPDGDGLAAAAPFPGNAVFGNGVLLATITYNLLSVGSTYMVLGDTNPPDLTEGFALNPPPVGAYADVNYVNDPANVIHVWIPEPATLALLGLGIVAMGRRR